MTLSDALSIVDKEGATAPSLFSDDEPIDVQVVTSGLTEQQAKWVREVKMLDALRGRRTRQASEVDPRRPIPSG